MPKIPLKKHNAIPSLSLYQIHLSFRTDSKQDQKVTSENKIEVSQEDSTHQAMELAHLRVIESAVDSATLGDGGRNLGERALTLRSLEQKRTPIYAPPDLSLMRAMESSTALTYLRGCWKKELGPTLSGPSGPSSILRLKGNWLKQTKNSKNSFN